MMNHKLKSLLSVLSACTLLFALVGCSTTQGDGFFSEDAESSSVETTSSKEQTSSSEQSNVESSSSEKSDTSSDDDASSASSSSVKQTADYELDNPEAWGFVGSKIQSPINIETSALKTMHDENPNVKYYYHSKINNIQNTGSTIQGQASGLAVINGRQFELSHFNFHAQSEHSIDGKYYPMDIQFIHKAQDGRVAVITAFFEEGAENEAFKEVLGAIGDTTKTDVTIDLRNMLPTNKSFYHYIGSLTSTPLTENVEWYVMKTPVAVSADQINQFKNYYSNNNRQIQDLNGRVVLDHEE